MLKQILLFLLIILTQESLSQKYFDTNPFKNISYYTEVQDVFFDSLSNTYLSAFSSRAFNDSNYLNPTNAIISYDTAGNILKQRSWVPFVSDTIFKTEMITKYRDSLVLIGNMKINGLNYLFIANTDTALNILNIKKFSFPKNDSNFVYYIRFDTLNNNYNYVFFHRTYHYSNPVGIYTTPYVIKVSKNYLDSIHLYQIAKDSTPASIYPYTYAYTWAEFSLNDSTFKTVYIPKHDSLNQFGQPQYPYVSTTVVSMINIDSNFIFKPSQSIKIWDTTHFNSNLYSIRSAWLPSMIPISSNDYIFCNQMYSMATLWSPNNYYIGVFRIDKRTDTVKQWKRIPAYPDYVSDSTSAMHILSRRKGFVKFDDNNYYIIGSQGQYGEALFIYSLDSSLNIKWSRFIKKDSVRRFNVESVDINYRGEIIIAAYADIDGSNFDYPVILKMDTSGNFTIDVNSFDNIYSVKLYPNPSSKYLILETNSDIVGSDFIVYNLEGKKLLSSQLNSTQHRIDISNLKMDCYLFEIRTRNKRILTGKFIKE